MMRTRSLKHAEFETRQAEMWWDRGEWQLLRKRCDEKKKRQKFYEQDRLLQLHTSVVNSQCQLRSIFSTNSSQCRLSPWAECGKLTKTDSSQRAMRSARLKENTPARSRCSQSSTTDFTFSSTVSVWDIAQSCEALQWEKDRLKQIQEGRKQLTVSLLLLACRWGRQLWNLLELKAFDAINGFYFLVSSEWAEVSWELTRRSQIRRN